MGLSLHNNLNHTCNSVLTENTKEFKVSVLYFKLDRLIYSVGII